jgi:hypothetical protein
MVDAGCMAARLAESLYMGDIPKKQKKISRRLGNY